MSLGFTGMITIMRHACRDKALYFQPNGTGAQIRQTGCNYFLTDTFGNIHTFVNLHIYVFVKIN